MVYDLDDSKCNSKEKYSIVDGRLVPRLIS